MGDWAELPDGDLVLRSREGDEEAFAALVDRYARTAYSVALSVTGTPEDAEDAAQESFIVALERLEDCRRPERFVGWFLAIVRNRARNLVRREELRNGEAIPESQPSLLRHPDRAAEDAELRHILEAALDELPRLQREIVLLHDLEGWKHREIADRLDMPTGTVRSHLHHARKALRRVLRADLPGTGSVELRGEAAS